MDSYYQATETEIPLNFPYILLSVFDGLEETVVTISSV